MSLEDQPKENLVLVHSFPTNSNLLAGFYDYLGTFFKVYPVDLPGFTKESQPLNQISIPNYAQFVQNQIHDLEIDQFLLGGISFGFAVVNKVVPDPRCRGIIAMEPYLNVESLQMNPMERLSYVWLLRLASITGLGERLWTSPNFREILVGITKYPVNRVEAMIDQIKPKTFFETARVILENESQPKFQALPYALVVNPADDRVSYGHLLQMFKQGVDDLHLVHTQVDHYPSDLSVDYFNQRIDPLKITTMIDWFNVCAA